MAKHLTISGKVQGVGYRASFAAQAEALKLSGWVRNRSDGNVEALVAGDVQAIDEMLAWARRGPPGARVDQMMVQDRDAPSTDSPDFRILPTV